MVCISLSLKGYGQAFQEVEILLRLGLFENTNASLVQGSNFSDSSYEFDTEENLSSSLLELGAKVSFLENHRFVVSLGTFTNGQILSGFMTDDMQMVTEVRPLVVKFKYLNFRVGHEVLLPLSENFSFYFQNAFLLQTLTNGADVKALEINSINYSYAGELGFDIVVNDYFNFNTGFTMFRYLKSYETEKITGDFKPISYGFVLGFGYKLSGNYW
jgi:hypothetical protein